MSASKDTVDRHGDYHAALSSVVMFDLGDRSQIEISGSDRVKFLQNFCTNDLNRLQPGQGCEAFVTNIKGRVLGHIFVFLAPNSVWIDSVPGADEPLLTHLDRYLIAEDVELHDRTAEFAELLVTGPQSAATLAATGIDAQALDLYAHSMADLHGVAVAVRRVDWFGQPGYLLSIARDRFDDARNALADGGIRSAGKAAFEALRIEAGFPQYGIDITEDNIAQEVSRTALAISFTKGCYLGQEPIARLDAMGHVNRQLCVVRLAAGPVPATGTTIFAGDNDQQAGRITSATISPADDLPVALAYLRSRFAEPGTRVTVRDGSESIPATVHKPNSS